MISMPLKDRQGLRHLVEQWLIGGRFLHYRKIVAYPLLLPDHLYVISIRRLGYRLIHCPNFRLHFLVLDSSLATHLDAD